MSTIPGASAGNRFKGNGNKFKGNKAKKGGRGRKNVYAEFDPKTDQYARVYSIEGGKHLKVVPLNNTESKPIVALIRGIHHKRVWFKKDDIVVITGDSNLMEVVGKVNEGDVTKVRTKFDKLEGGRDTIFIDENEFSDEEEDKKPVSILPQPNRPFDLIDQKDESEEFDFDDL